MAYTLNGIGTKFYGIRDVREDNSYITTEWITILYVPIIPIRSFRVRPSSAPDHYQPFPVGIPIGTKHYLRGRATLPDWRQVLSVYGFIILSAVWITVVVNATIAGCTYLSKNSYANAAVIFGVIFPILVIGPLALLPRIFRARASRRSV
jgi:hypothetical protein